MKAGEGGYTGYRNMYMYLWFAKSILQSNFVAKTQKNKSRTMTLIEAIKITNLQHFKTIPSSNKQVSTLHKGVVGLVKQQLKQGSEESLQSLVLMLLSQALCWRLVLCVCKVYVHTYISRDGRGNH